MTSCIPSRAKHHHHHHPFIRHQQTNRVQHRVKNGRSPEKHKFQQFQSYSPKWTFSD